MNSTQKANLEANYRKFWSILCVNMPFMFAIDLIRRKWDLPLKAEKFSEMPGKRGLFVNLLMKLNQEFFNSETFKPYIPIIDLVSNLRKSKEFKKKVLTQLLEDLPSHKFSNDIQKLSTEFKFDSLWIPHLTNFIITDRITVPAESKDEDAPPNSALSGIKILKLVALKEAQHSFLKREYGFKESKRKADSKTKAISELDSETSLLPQKLLHSYADIADIVWGEVNWDQIPNNEFSIIDKRRVQKVKTGLNRLKSSKFYTALTPTRAKELTDIFS